MVIENDFMVVLVEFQWFMILYGDWEWFYGSFSGISVILYGDLEWFYGSFSGISVIYDIIWWLRMILW